MSLFPNAVVLPSPVTPPNPSVPVAMVRFTPAANATSTVGVGTSVAWAGDMDGDRFGEFVVGAPFADGPLFGDSGFASLVRGRANWDVAATASGAITQSVDPGAFFGPQRFALRNEAGLALTGFSVAGAGDVNGDGRADVVVGVPGFGVSGALLSGTAVLLPGAAVFPSLNVTLPTLSASATRLSGVQAAGDWAGFSVAGAGDVDGDGHADVLVGLPLADRLGRETAGAAALVMGMPGATLDAAAAGGTVRTHLFLGAEAGDSLGLSVASAGDLNGDGFADFVLAAPNANPLGRASAGSAYVVFGQSGGWTTEVDLASPGPWGLRVDGASIGARLGSAVAAAGDVNGDGFGDLLLGAPTETDDTGAPVGAAYLLFGSATLASSGNLDLAGAAGGRWVVLRGGSVDGLGDGAGAALAGGGDVNGDGFADLAIGARDTGGGRGTVFVVLGHGGSWGDLALNGLTAEQGERVDGLDGTFGGFGASVAINGDGNADGRSDLLVGAPFQGSSGNRPGEAWLVFSQGAAASPVTLRGTTLADSLGGGAGDDRLTGFGGRDILVGRAGNDTISGGDGNDSLFGQDGNDVLQGGSGDNLLDGGANRDLASYADFTLAVVANLGSGVVVTSPVAFTLDRLVAVEDWAGGAGDDIAFGTDLANALMGGAGADALYGLGGSDTLFGNEGDDRLQGGSGNDVLVGGDGSDVYAITDTGDTVTELAGDLGEDQALVSADGWVAGPDIEFINLVGATAARVTGGATAEAIAGNAGRGNSIDGRGGDDQIFGAALFADTLRGGAGDDVVRGMGGGDTLIGGAGADQMVGAPGVRDVFLYDAAGWAPNPASVAPGARFADEIFGFVRGEDVLQFSFVVGVISTASFAAINPFAYQVLEEGVLVDRTNVQIVGRDGSLIHVYGILGNTTLAPSDFVFG